MSRRWSLVAVVTVGAALPWYSLRLAPVLTVGNAKVNILDALVMVAVLLAVPQIVRSICRRDPPILWTCAFMLGTVIPFIIGVRDPQASFFAIREARGLAFYAITLAFAVGCYRAKHFRLFADAYVLGALIAVFAVFLHTNWRIPVPGYPDQFMFVVGGPGTVAAVIYLEWTTPVVAFMLGLVEFMMAGSARAMAGWGAAAVMFAWYVLAASERFAQILLIIAAVAALAVPTGRSRRARRLGAAGVILAAAFLLGVAALRSPSLRTWTHLTAIRWSVAFSDGSLSYRIRESIAGLRLAAHNPLIGVGLGTAIPIAPPAGPVEPWHYLSTGYAYLLVRTGVLGFLLYSSMVGTALTFGWRYREVEPPCAWPMRNVGIAGMLILLTANVLHPVVDIPESVIAFGLFFGMLVSPPAGAGRRIPEGALADTPLPSHRGTGVRVLRRAIPLVLVAFAVVATVQVRSAMRDTALLRRAQQQIADIFKDVIALNAGAARPAEGDQTGVEVVFSRDSPDLAEFVNRGAGWQPMHPSGNFTLRLPDGVVVSTWVGKNVMRAWKRWEPSGSHVLIVPCIVTLTSRSGAHADVHVETDGRVWYR